MSVRRWLPPEAWFLFFGFLLHYPWEFLQVPFFEGVPSMPHWEAVVFCSGAAAGDAVIGLVAYWLASATARDRRWYFHPAKSSWAVYLGAGLAITIVMEWLATEVLARWTYAESMPTLPGIGTGLTPLLQWSLLPPLILWLARGQSRPVPPG